MALNPAAVKTSITWPSVVMALLTSWRMAASIWNCPMFITPRFTAAEVEAAVAPLKTRIAELESQLKLQTP